MLKRQVPDFILEIWGHGDYTEKLSQEIRQLGLEKNNILKGWGDRGQILAALSTSKVLLQTSDFEGMSVAVMEALAMGCSVVSSEVSGVEDYSKIEGAQDLIRLYPISQTEQAAGLLAQALNAHDEAIARKARSFAEEHFDIAVCMDKYQALAQMLTLNPERRPLPQPGRLHRVFSRGLALARFIKYQAGL